MFYFTHGDKFLATFCITKSAASLHSQETAGSCNDINIDLKTFDDPRIKTTSLIRSETFKRNS